MTEAERYLDYLNMLRKPFHKLARLRFLQPDGSTAFLIDNNPDNPRSSAFLSEGQINMNWQNGQRRSASVTLCNLDGQFDFNLNHIWFGQEIALDEGLVLSDGSEYYLPQGVFLLNDPVENLQPVERTVSWNLVDKTAALDGTLGGTLESTYQVNEGVNIFAPITALLIEDRGNGTPLDRVKPIFTDWYNGKTQALPDGSTALLTNTAYDVVADGESESVWTVIEELCAMVNAWVGYDPSGALRIDPSQDDILDSDKPVVWSFSMEEAELLGAAYTVKKSEVFNDFIVVGERLDNYAQPFGRAQNRDERSPTNIQTIGRKTKRLSAAGYATDTQCQDRAEWELKRSSVLHRAVNISCTQLFHIDGNQLVTLQRTDKPGSPVERHLIQSFSRPLTGTEPMSITATSVMDFEIATTPATLEGGE